jgi:hypothetical protein
MTTYTLQDLMYAKGTSEPVRQALQEQANLIANLTEQRNIYCNQAIMQMAEIERLTKDLERANKVIEGFSADAKEWFNECNEIAREALGEQT